MGGEVGDSEFPEGLARGCQITQGAIRPLAKSDFTELCAQDAVGGKVLD